MNTQALIGQATPEEIKAWKGTHKNGIYALEVDGHIGYFKNPSRHDMNLAMSKASAEAALDMYETMLGATFIGGSEAILNNDDMFFGALQQIKTKMDGKKAVLVNL